MKIKIYVDNEEKIVEHYEVCFEVAEDRFKSLRINNGHYPENSSLDYKDKTAFIIEDFIVDHSKEGMEELKSAFNMIKTEKQDDTLVIKEPWFGFKKHTPFIYIQMKLSNIF